MAEATLKQLRDLLDGAEREVALRDMLNEQSNTMSEILERLSEQGPAMAKAVGDALKDLTLTVSAPDVKVNVPAPIVNFVPPNAKARSWRFQVKYLPGGGIDEIVATSN